MRVAKAATDAMFRKARRSLEIGHVRIAIPITLRVGASAFAAVFLVHLDSDQQFSERFDPVIGFALIPHVDAMFLQIEIPASVVIRRDRKMQN
jgi:hypothetical protein